MDLVTDVFDLDADDELREQIEKAARHLYGLVHARYIVTTRGLAKMVCDRKRGKKPDETQTDVFSSSISTKSAISESALESYVRATLFCPWANMTFPIRVPSGFTVPNAKIFTTPSRLAMAPSMVPTLGLLSTA